MWLVTNVVVSGPKEVQILLHYWSTAVLQPHYYLMLMVAPGASFCVCCFDQYNLEQLVINLTGQ